MEVDPAEVKWLLATLGQPAAAALHDTPAVSVRLAPGPLCMPRAARTRVGGVPLLDPGAEWPHTDDGEPLPLVGLLNADQINEILGEAALPAGKLLCFFLATGSAYAWGQDSRDDRFWRVIVADAAAACAPSPPAGVRLSRARAMNGRRVLTMPDPDEPIIEQYWSWGDSAYDRYAALASNAPRPSSWPRPPDGTLPSRSSWLGQQESGAAALRHAEPSTPEPRATKPGSWLGQEESGSFTVNSGFGADPTWWRPVAATTGEPSAESSHRVLGWPDLHHAHMRDHLPASHDDWRLLWQVDSGCSEHDQMWGDMGKLYFWIRSDDLADARFDRLWVLLQG